MASSRKDSSDSIDCLLGELAQSIFDLLPEASTGSSVGDHFVGMLAFRQLATYQGVQVLLMHGLHSEATALVRRQFEDTLRLGYLVKHPDEANGLYYGLMWGHLNPRRREIEALAARGRTVSGLLDQIRQEEKELLDSQEKSRTKTRRWKSVTALASELKRDGDRLVWVSASPSSHSGLSIAAPFSNETGRMVIALTSSNLQERRMLAGAAGRYLSESVSFAAKYLKWHKGDRAHAIFSAWQAKLEGLDLS